MLDKNVNQNQIPYQAVQPADLNQQGVPMQAGIPANPELLKEDIQDTYVANRVANTTDDPKAMLGTAGLLLPTWLLITQSMDQFAKHSTGDYEKTIQYKIGKFGDSVVDSQFAKSSFGQTLTNAYKSVARFMKEKIIDKTRLTRAAFYTPSLAENHMARANQIGMEAMQLFDFSNPVDSFVKPEKFIEDLDTYGATKEEITKFQSELAKITDNAARKNYILEKEYETLIKNTRDAAESARLANGFRTADAAGKAKILKDLKAFELGFKDFAHLEVCKSRSHEHIHEIFEALCNSNKKMFARDWGSNHSKFTQFCTKWFGREVRMSEIVNKLFAELQYRNLDKEENKELKAVFERTGYIKHLPKSKFAKYLNHYTHLITEGATNRVAGGKAVALMQAWFLAEAIYKSIKAEGGLGEKAKTFSERFVELVALFATIPLALKLMHGVGGLQYAGMTKDQVKEYRKKLKLHNEKAMSGEFASKEAWKASKNELKTMLKAGVKNPFVKLGKWVGRVVTVGLEQIRPYDKQDIGVMKDGQKVYRKGIKAKLVDLWHHPKFGIKQMAGYPMRIGLGMIILMPFLSKLAVKGSHLIFGKPKHSLLDEEKEQEAAEKAAEQRTQTQIPPQLQNPNAINQQAMQGNQPQTNHQQQPMQQGPYQPSQTNLLNPYRNGQPYQTNPNVQATATTTSTTVNNNQNKNNEPVRTYVPSPVGVKLNGQEDVTPAEQALQRADLAEQQALKTLKMN